MVSQGNRMIVHSLGSVQLSMLLRPHVVLTEHDFTEHDTNAAPCTISFPHACETQLHSLLKKGYACHLDEIVTSESTKCARFEGGAPKRPSPHKGFSPRFPGCALQSFHKR